MRFRFGDHLIDPAGRELRRGSQPVAVEPQVFDLLLYLLRNRERVVSKDDLIGGVWGGRIVSDATINSRVKAARHALGDSGASQALIRTFPRKGIRFVGEAEEEGEAAPIPASPAATPVQPALALPDKPSIAVLPFTNMSSDPEQAFFADGIAEDITTALSRYHSLFVIARNSSFTYKDRSADVKQIGRELGVRYVLEGSLRKAGGQIRVTAQLIEAESGNHLWAERYDRGLADIFAVQDEITEAIARQTVPAVSHAEQRRAMRKPPDSLDAWEAYQRGLWHFGKSSPEETLEAEKLFRRATELDPNFAGGYAGLVRVQIWAAAAWRLRDLSEVLRAGEPLARRAVALDATDADARVALSGVLLLAHADYEGARREAETAVAISPNHAQAHGELGRVLVFAGHPREGIAALRTGIRLDPRDPLLAGRLNQLVIGFYFAREYEAAIDAAKQAIRSNPDHALLYRWLAAALGQAGRTAEAREALAQAIAIAPASFDLFVRRRVRWHRPEDYEHMLDGLRKAGWSG